MKKWSLILVPALLVMSLLVPAGLAGAQETGLTITKTPDKTAASLGETITYTYVITNTTNVTVSDLTLVDDKLGAITLSPTSLGAGASLTVTATHTVAVADFPGPIANKATAGGKDPNGNSLTAEATASVTLSPYSASLTVVKSADKASASPHETITYTYTITNNSDVAIGSLVLTDSKLGAVSLSTTALNPDESVTATKTYEVTVADLPGPIVNTATVQGADPLGSAISATSDSVSVSLTINKSLLTKAEILKLSGVPGKGIDTAPGLQKPFNPKSRASERAGKKK